MGETGSIAEAFPLVHAIDDKLLRRLQIREVAWQLCSLALARGEDGMIIAALMEVESLEEEDPPPAIVPVFTILPNLGRHWKLSHGSGTGWLV